MDRFEIEILLLGFAACAVGALLVGLLYVNAQ
ncbi:MAG: hypothetical protein [Caudoviricetes sp.]|nr:MAG: hypothetical protein [Caudoviricetes sp.]